MKKPIKLVQADLAVMYAGLATLASRMVEIGKISVDAGLTGIALSYSDFEDAHSVLTERWPTLQPGTYEFSHLEYRVLYSATWALKPVLDDLVWKANQVMMTDALDAAAADLAALAQVKEKIDRVLGEYIREEFERDGA